MAYSNAVRKRPAMSGAWRDGAKTGKRRRLVLNGRGVWSTDAPGPSSLSHHADPHMHLLFAALGAATGVLYSRSYNAHLTSYQATKERYQARRAEQRAALEERHPHASS